MLILFFFSSFCSIWLVCIGWLCCQPRVRFIQLVSCGMLNLIAPRMMITSEFSFCSVETVFMCDVWRFYVMFHCLMNLCFFLCLCVPLDLLSMFILKNELRPLFHWRTLATTITGWLRYVFTSGLLQSCCICAILGNQSKSCVLLCTYYFFVLIIIIII